MRTEERSLAGGQPVKELRLSRGYQRQLPGTMAFGELVALTRRGKLGGHLFAYSSVTLHVPRLAAMRRPLLTAALLLLLSRGSCLIVDDLGNSQHVSLTYVGANALRWIWDAVSIPFFVRHFRRRTQALAEAMPGPMRPAAERRDPVLYVTPVMVFGTCSGGIIGHTAGVLNALQRAGHAPVWVTTDGYAAVSLDVERIVVEPPGRFQEFDELPWFAMNDRLSRGIVEALEGRTPTFIYQRSFPGCIAVAESARRLRVPYVLEFNSSAVNFARMWGRRLRYERTVRAAERATLQSADLVVVVSNPLRDQVVRLGVDQERTLVNPNGVDVLAFSPEVDGRRVRRQLGIASDDFVVGFVGTFYPFHGAGVLLEAFGQALDSASSQRQPMRLLMVGDGPEVESLKRQAAEWNLSERVVFTGATNQVDGPAYMAACDVLAAPYVHNSDGSAFWGSPVKLFEYMSMGKPVVASGLGQVLEVIEEGRTGLVVKPADAMALSEAILTLLGSESLRRHLGEAARIQAVLHHSWDRHVRQILERVERLDALDADEAASLPSSAANGREQSLRWADSSRSLG